MELHRVCDCSTEYQIWFFRILDRSNFEEHFKKLPQCFPKTDTNQGQPSVQQQDINDNDGSKATHEVTSPVTSNRQILDKRRNFVMQLFELHGYYPPDNVTVNFQQMHRDIFPNKLSLQIKIREVRQNIMKKPR